MQISCYHVIPLPPQLFAQDGLQITEKTARQIASQDKYWFQFKFT